MFSQLSRISFHRIAWISLFCIVCQTIVVAGDAVAPKPEELFPESTLFAVAIPDLDAARTAAANSRIGAIFKQPDMRAFLDPIVAKISANYAKLRATDARLPAPADLDVALFAGEVAVCLYSRVGSAEPGVIISFKPKDVKAFETLLTPLLNGQPLPVDKPIPMGMGDAAGGALYSRGRLVLCKPFSDMESVTARIDNAQKRATGTLAVSPVFKTARTGTGETHAWIFANPAPLIELAHATAPNQKPTYKAVFNAAGMNTVGGIMLGLNFVNGEPVAQFYMGSVGAPEGIFSLVSTTGVKKELFQIVAEDSPYVTAGGFHFDRLIPAIKKIAAVISPDALAAFDGALAQVAEQLKFDLQKDLLQNIEPDMAYAQTRMDTAAALSFSPGMVGMFRLKNGAKVEECIQKSMALASAMLPQMQLPQFMARLSTTTYKGTSLYYLSQPINGSICLAVIKDKLIWGTSVNAVKRGIDQLGTGSNILASKSFQTAIARVSGKPFDADKLPASLAYSVDNGGGNGILMLTMLGLGAETAVVAGLSEVITKAGAPEDLLNANPMLREITRSAGGRLALDVVNALDLNLWPDEAFFAQHRLAHASVGTFDEKGWSGRTELPPPMPASNWMSMTTIGAVAVVAAIAVPNLLRSRMAANESAAVANCKAYCSAQDIYRRTDYNKDGVLEYAQAIKGDNSLFETKAGLGDIMLVDRTFANAEGNPGKGTPKAGYNFKILTKQGAKAEGGARDYVNAGHLNSGYALVAYPAKYDGLGRNTFIVNNSGIIYQKDMGSETHSIVEKMTEYNPDETWVVAE